MPLDKRLYQFLAPNVRFNALQAAVLKPQISKLNQIINRKIEIAKLLYEKFLDVSDFILPQKILNKAKHSYYSFPLYVTKDKKYRDSLLKLLAEEYNLHCAYGYANPVPLYLCVNALIKPDKYGKGFKFSEHNYPKGLCPNAENLLSKSFLIPFNENFTDSDMLEIANRVINAVNEKMPR